MQISILPLFSSPVVHCRAPFEVASLFAQLKNEDRFRYVSTKAAIGRGEPGSSEGSEDLRVLDQFPMERGLLLNCFHSVIGEVFGWTETEFQVTRSWTTKANYNSCGHFHSHFNSFFSGVLYERGGEGFAPLEFERGAPSCPSFLMPPPSAWNIYNSELWRIVPEDGALVFFPSHLRHRVGLHLSQEPRYSLAFNLFPTGNIGQGDSQVGVNLLQN